MQRRSLLRSHRSRLPLIGISVRWIAREVTRGRLLSGWVDGRHLLWVYVLPWPIRRGRRVLVVLPTIVARLSCLPWLLWLLW
jgi:hypothetical protein